MFKRLLGLVLPYLRRIQNYNNLEWRLYHLTRKNWFQDEFEDELYHDPRKLLLTDRILSYRFASILEVGCGPGGNLYTIARSKPAVRCVGVDINSSAVKYGNDFFRRHGLINVQLEAGRADKLKFADKSFDIVFTRALLLYVGKTRISKVASELCRVACKAVILMEYHDVGESAQGSVKHAYWVRDYVKLLSPYAKAIRLQKVPPSIWGGIWGEYGYIIEATMQR